MPRTLLLRALGLVAVLVSGCSLASPTASGSVEQSRRADATSSASAAAVQYTSERFGYSIELPGEWRYRAATEDWPPNVYPSGGAEYIDNFEQPPAPLPTVDIMTQPLGAGMTQEAFMAWLDEENAKICTVEETEETTVDGRTGRLQRQTCGYNAWEVAVFDGDQVYLIYWLGEPSRIDAERPIFDEVIDSFRFSTPDAS